MLTATQVHWASLQQHRAMARHRSEALLRARRLHIARRELMFSRIAHSQTPNVYDRKPESMMELAFCL